MEAMDSCLPKKQRGVRIDDEEKRKKKRSLCLIFAPKEDLMPTPI